MQITNKFTGDDSAVSPVIGVILMVAITVILAAVIASFVLGLGDSANEVQPNTSFNFDYNDSGDTVTVTLADGESLEVEEVYFRGDVSSNEALDSGGYSIVDNWSAGQAVDVDVTGSSYTLNVVWESQDSDDTSTLQTDEGPDA